MSRPLLSSAKSWSEEPTPLRLEATLRRAPDRIVISSLRNRDKHICAQSIRRLRPGDDRLFTGMLDLFADVFEDPDSYKSKRPGRIYRDTLLAQETFVAPVAVDGETVIGAAAAYELPKFEQERSEMYLYDLAVARSHRRRGIATALIDGLREIARERGARILFVQADHGDDAAIALYSKLGRREDVLHFDIETD